MDALSRSSSSSSLLALPTTPTSGLQVFAIFVNFFFPALALIVVSIRVAGRVATSHFAVDDWLVCVAMFMSIAQTVISFFFIKTNFIGISPSSRPPDQLIPSQQALIWSYSIQILYNPILALVKSSLLIFLCRLFSQNLRLSRFLLYVNILNVAQMVAVFFAIILQCTPISFNWDQSSTFSSSGPQGKCVDRRVLYTANSVFNILTDLIILGVPVVVFSRLRLPKRVKLGLVGVFMLGGLVTITSIVRLALLVQGLFGIHDGGPTAATAAARGNNGIGFITSGIETNLALITASAPALRPLFRSRDRGGWFGGTTRTSPGTQNVGGKRGKGAADGDDLEAKPVGWPDDNDYDAISPTNTATAEAIPGAAVTTIPRGGKGGRRGGTRGGRLGGRRTAQQSSKRGGRGGGKLRPVIRIRTDVAMAAAAELRSHSPRSSEEETMTVDGIRKMSDVRREVDGLVKEIGVAGGGSYIIGRGVGFYPPPSSRLSLETIRIGALMSPSRPESTVARSATRDGPPPPPPSQRPRTRDGERPVTRDGTGVGRNYYPPERYYSESIYPDYAPGPPSVDLDLRIRDEERKYNEDRISRRYGVVTPREGRTPTTATSRGWDDGGGRPF